MAATLYVAVFDAATTDPSWARADVGNGRNGWQASGYVASAVDPSPPTSTTNNDAPGITLTGLSAGASYRLWAIWDDGSTSSNKVSSAEFIATPTLTVPVAAHAQTAGNVTLSVATTETLTVAAASHAQTAASVALSSSSVLAAADAAHNHLASALTLDVSGAVTLSVSAALHLQEAGQLTLSTSTLLAVAGALHNSQAENLALTITPALNVASASHSQVATAPTLSTSSSVSLQPANTTHGHSAAAPSLLVDITLSVLSAAHSQYASVALFGDPLTLIYKILANRNVLDPVTGKLVIYDDDDTTVLLQANAWADAAGTVPYSGGPLMRIDRLQ